MIRNGRHSACLRLLALLFLILFLPAGGSASAEHDPLALIDSLLTVSRFDSVLVMAPALIDEALSKNDSTRYGRLLTARGRAELATGKYMDGLESIDLSLEISRGIGDTLNWMNALGFKGFALTWQGRYEECLRLNEKKLTLSQLTGDRPSEAWARTALGYVYLKQGDLERARTEYTLASDLFRAEGMKQEELTPLIGLGRVYNTLQDVGAARDCYQRVLAAARELGDLVQESHAVNNLGTLEYVYGDMSLAAQYFERAYDLSRARGNQRGTITPASNIALARTYLGNYDEAAKILSYAIRTCEKQHYRDLLGSVTNKLGEVRYMQKRMNAAAGLYRRSLAMEDTLSGKQHFEALFGLAMALSNMDSTAEAIVLLETDLGTALVQEHEIKNHLLLSRYLREDGRPEDALARLSKVRKQVWETDITNQKLFASFEFSASCREVGRLAESYKWYIRGVELLDERRRSSEEYQWREVNTGTWNLKDQCRIVLEYPPDRTEPERIEELFDIFQRFKAKTLIERITEPRHQSGPSSDISRLPAITLAELQDELLRPGELFLDFVVGNEEAYLFAVTADTCRMVTLPGRKSGFSEKIDLYCGAMGNRPGGGQGGSARIGLAGMHESLGDSILGQVGDMVRDASCILVAPDQYFNSIPFGVLAPAGDFGTGELLCMSKEIHRVPSATVLRWLRARPGGDGATERSSRIMAVAPGGGVRLKGAEKEVEFLQGRFYGVDVSRGGREEFISGMTCCDVIHVATHIEVNAEKAWHSGILIERADPPRTPDETGDEIVPAGTLRGASLEFRPDPYLRAGEIAASSIPAKLVVLSGCESARGQVVVAEGVLGLTSAFLSAGASAVVATLWPVDDAVTTDLMKEFYKELARGGTVASALREAQLEIRRHGDTSHPFYWAGFVVIGDGSVTVCLEKKWYAPPERYILPLIVLAVLVAVVRMLAVRSRKEKPTRSV